MQEVRGGAGAHLAAPPGHHDLSLLVLPGGRGETHGPDRLSECHGRDADQGNVKVVGTSRDFELVLLLFRFSFCHKSNVECRIIISS